MNEYVGAHFFTFLQKKSCLLIDYFFFLRFQNLSFLRYKQISILLRRRTKQTEKGKAQKM